NESSPQRRTVAKCCLPDGIALVDESVGRSEPSIPVLRRIHLPAPARAGKGARVTDVVLFANVTAGSSRAAMLEDFLSASCLPLRFFRGWHFSSLRAVYHSMTAAPHVSPAPNATSNTRSPRRMRPDSTASSSAIGTEAPDVLPYRSRFTNIC